MAQIFNEATRQSAILLGSQKFSRAIHEVSPPQQAVMIKVNSHTKALKGKLKLAGLIGAAQRDAEQRVALGIDGAPWNPWIVILTGRQQCITATYGGTLSDYRQFTA